MNSIRPVSDLRNNFADISKTVHDTQQPVFLTKNGYGDMVLMSMKTYEEQLLMLDVFTKIAEAEEDIKEGKTLDAKAALKDLRTRFNV